jgi:anti-sigma factor RsiW
MTDPAPQITKDDLHAHVDGLLGPARRAAVERYLLMHPEVASHVEEYRAQRDGLRAALAEDMKPVPPSLDLMLLVEERLLRRRTPRWAAVVVMLALGIGGAGGWWLGPRPAAGLDAVIQETAASYAIYAVDAHRPVELGAPQRDELTHWLSGHLDRPVTAPDLSAVGYRFLGGRLVATEHGAAALFIYEDGRGERLAVFVRPLASAHATPIETVDVGNMDGCAWVDRGLAYTLVANESYKRLLSLSEHVRQQALQAS